MSKKGRKTKRLGAYSLEYVKLTSFGCFSNRIVGPFVPGMNVVLGPNEAGKTTVTELIKGVMFGWPTARGAANPYRPETAERTGSLFFRGEDDEERELSRAKNSEGVIGDVGLLADIDRDTYETMFALTSDELLGLDRHDEVTARLLTAGSGTSSSPAHALESVNDQIRALMSRSAQNPDSLVNLREEQARLRAQISAGLDEANGLRDQERSLASLMERRETLSAASESLNERIERLKTARSRVAELDEEVQATLESLDATQEACRASCAEEQRPPEAGLADVASLSAADELRVRDALEDFEAKQVKLDHAVDIARKDANRSRSDYEVLMADARLNDRRVRARTRRRLQAVLAVVIPIAMVLVGLLALNRVNGGAMGMSYLAAAVALVLFAAVIATVGVAMSVRPTQVEEELESERTKMAWVMQQDAKNLEACEHDAEEHRAALMAYLNDNGLAAARGSLRHARRLLDQARDYRVKREAAAQNSRALTLQRAALAQALDKAREQRAQAVRSIGLDQDTSLEEIDRLIDQAADERTRTACASHENERAIGEITQRLSAARHARSFDQAKIEAEQVETRFAEGRRRLAMLLIARESLEAAIVDWEGKSQPEVYARASQLFEDMTGGAWRQVRTNDAGSIEVVDAVKTVRDPRLLSLGTRQQLYLALRIALLMTADNVGRCVPVLCDDILVNFDDERRERAAQALVELSRRRQVILFTCHPDVASMVSGLDPSGNLIEL